MATCRDNTSLDRSVGETEQTGENGKEISVLSKPEGGLLASNYIPPEEEIDGSAMSALVSGNAECDGRHQTLLMRQLREKEKEIEELRKIVEEQQKRIDEYEKMKPEMEKLKKENCCLNTEIKEAQKLRDKAQSQCNKLSDEVKTLKTEVEMLKSNVSELMEQTKLEKEEVQERFDHMAAEREQSERCTQEQLAQIINLLSRNDVLQARNDFDVNSNSNSSGNSANINKRKN